MAKITYITDKYTGKEIPIEDATREQILGAIRGLDFIIVAGQIALRVASFTDHAFTEISKIEIQPDSILVLNTPAGWDLRQIGMFEQYFLAKIKDNNLLPETVKIIVLPYDTKLSTVEITNPTEI